MLYLFPIFGGEKLLVLHFRLISSHVKEIVTRLKITLGGMPHLAAGLELELQAKNIAPEKATKVK